MNTTANADTLVADYLAALRRAAADLAPAERDELLADIAGHIATARAESSDDAEPDVRNILDRLGRPADIAAAARGERATSAVRPAGPLDYVGLAVLAFGVVTTGVTVVLMSFGAYLASMAPFVVPLVGLVLVALSPCWSRGQKVAAAAVTVLPSVVLYLFSSGLWFPLAEETSGYTPPVAFATFVGLALIATAILGPGVAAAVLFSELRRQGR